MQITQVQRFTPSPRFTPRELVRLTRSEHGVDLCFGQLRDVPLAQIELAAVFAVGRPTPSTRLLLCVAGQDRPLLFPADGVAYTAFSLPATAVGDEALREWLRRLDAHHPGLQVPATTERFVAGEAPEEIHPSEIPELGTSLRVAVVPELAEGLKPLEERPAKGDAASPVETHDAPPTAGAPKVGAGSPAAPTRPPTEPRPDDDPTSARHRKIAERLGVLSAEPPPAVLPPFGPELRFGPHRRGELIKAFEGQPAPVGMKLKERLVGLAAAAVASVVPLLYLAMLGGLCFAIYFQAATRGRELVEELVAGRWDPSSFSFLVPILVCLYLIVVLLSLLFPGRSVPRYSLFLKRNQELVLFGFVEQLSKTLKAPMPERIEVAIESDVAIALRPKEVGQALTLTLGLPMVAGASLSQLTGLIGREMAMLAERSDSWLIGYTEGLRTGLERMVADCLERQERTVRGLGGEGQTGLSSVVRGLASFVFFSLARWLATLFATLGDWTGGWSRRWLTQTAREVEQRLVGPRTTSSAEALARELRAAHREVVGGIASASSGFPRLDHMPAQVVFESLFGDPGHCRPPAAEEPRPVFQSRLPASVLFRDFTGLSRQATVEYYRSQGIRKPELESIDDYLAGQWESDELERSIRRYFAGTITSRRPVPVAPRLESGDASNDTLLATALGLRGEFEASVVGYRQTLEDYDGATDCRLGAREAYKLVEADLEHQGISVAEWKVLESDALEQLKTLGPDIQQHETRSGQRLMSTLLLLTDPDFGQEIPGCESWRREVPQLLSTVATINRSFQALLELRDRYTVLETLRDVGEQSDADRRLALEIFEREIETLYSPISKIYRGLGTLADIFHYGGRDLGLSIRGIPNDYFALSYELLKRVYELYFRSLGRLAYVAERIELASGLAPLPDHGAFPESRPWRG